MPQDVFQAIRHIHNFHISRSGCIDFDHHQFHIGRNTTDATAIMLCRDNTRNIGTMTYGIVDDGKTVILHGLLGRSIVGTVTDNTRKLFMAVIDTGVDNGYGNPRAFGFLMNVLQADILQITLINITRLFGNVSCDCLGKGHIPGKVMIPVPIAEFYVAVSLDTGQVGAVCLIFIHIGNGHALGEGHGCEATIQAGT